MVEDRKTEGTATDRMQVLAEAFGDGVAQRATRIQQIRTALATSDPVVVRLLDIDRARDLVALQEATAALRDGVVNGWDVTGAGAEAQKEIARLAGKWSNGDTAVDAEVRRADDVIETVNRLHEFNDDNERFPTVSDADNFSYESMDQRAYNNDWSAIEVEYQFHQAALTVRAIDRDASSIARTAERDLTDVRLVMAAQQGTHPRQAVTATPKETAPAHSAPGDQGQQAERSIGR